MDQTTIKIENKKNEINEYDVLFTMNSDETNKEYIVYTDYIRDSDKNIKAYGAIYDKSGKLMQIKDEREWKTLEELINKFNKEDE
ncbi:MAG: hypothetical protein PHX40_01115 [Bacilli bacterium]|nr:hypothetical protein [Bacilli bacterium]